MTQLVISDDLRTARLLSVKELTDNSDNPTDDKSPSDYFGHN